MVKPQSVTVLGKKYTITYCDKPSEVDIFRRDSMWGQVDFWTRTMLSCLDIPAVCLSGI